MPQLKQCLHWILRKMLQSIESKKWQPFQKNYLQERTERTGLAYTSKERWEKWISITITLKQVKKPVIYHFPISSKYTEGKCFHLQSIGLELNTRKKLFKWNKILEHFTNGDNKNLIRKIYKKKLEIFWYDTAQLYLILTHTWSGWLHNLKFRRIQLFPDSAIMHSKNIPIL